MEKTDTDIIKQVLKGDKDAFSQIMNLYEAPLIRYVSRLQNDPHLTNDIVQDTFIKAYINLNGFDLSRKFSSWLYRIAHNETINKIRTKSKTFSIDLSELVVFSSENVEEDYAREEMKANLNKCLQNLDLKYRDVLVLFYLEEKSYDEICEILKIPMGTLSIRLKRGREKLKTLCQTKM